MEQPQRNRTGLIVAILVVLGLAAGAGLGLLIGWVIWPVNYFDTTFADLQVEHKEQYIILVASAYNLDHDLEKARARLDQLEAPNIQQWVAQLADRAITEGQDEAGIQALVELAYGLGVDSPRMVAYLATPTPPPTDTSVPSPTPAPTDTPTATLIPPTDTPVPPTDTPPPQPTDTPLPQPTDTPLPPTQSATAPKPQPTPTQKPKSTNTPKPPSPTNTPKPPATQWTWNAQLMGPANEPGQSCEGGAQYIRVTIVDAKGIQMGGIWIHDFYTGQTQVTGHKGADPYWGPGEAEIPCPGNGGAKVCIATDQSGTCASDYTRDMSCYYAPSFEDLWAAGYCECCGADTSKERCQEFYNTGAQCMQQARHYSWRVTFKRSW